MSSALPAYRYDSPQRAPEYPGRRRPGRAPKPEPQYKAKQGSRDRTARRPRQLNSSETRAWYTLAAVFAVVVLFAGAVGCFRISLSNATVTTELAIQELTSEISEARTAGNVLEVKDSSLQSSMNVKAAAIELGMSAPVTVDQLTLAPDIVATDEDGSLNLSESLRRVAGISETQAGMSPADARKAALAAS